MLFYTTYSVLLCVLEQAGVVTPAQIPSGSNRSNWLKAGPARNDGLLQEQNGKRRAEANV